MGLKQLFIHTRDTYVIRQVQNLRLPEFPSEELRRYRIVFSGRVQKVGFRLEISELARRLGLTGFCENLENGSVLTELQGTDDRIRYLLSFMESLKRIKIRQKTVEPLEPMLTETKFLQR